MYVIAQNQSSRITLHIQSKLMRTLCMNNNGKKSGVGSHMLDIISAFRVLCLVG